MNIALVIVMIVEVIGICWKPLAPVCMMFPIYPDSQSGDYSDGSRLLRIPHIAIQGQPCILAWGPCR